MIEPQEIVDIVVVSSQGEIDTLASAIRDAGSWSLVPLAWPDSRSLIAAQRDAARALIVGSDSIGNSIDLVELVRKRPKTMPLVVVGKIHMRAAEPDAWLPVAKTRVLGPLLSQLCSTEARASAEMRAVGAPTWRRKTDMIIGNSTATQQLLHSLDQLAPAQTPVLISGESGVGKELVARALHYCGPRSNAPFVAINCAAIPETLFESELFGYERGAFTGAMVPHAGAFEAAHRGTLFLDEIGELPLPMQAKLLRVLETSEVVRVGSTERRKVNFRLVTATNRTLEREVREGRFREDLYYRIMVYPLRVSSLRDRPEDIPPIVTHHLSVIGNRENRPALRMTAAAVERMMQYRWPGNVRELVNTLERAVLLSNNHIIDVPHLVFPRAATPDPSSPQPEPPLLAYRDAKAKFEKDYYSNLIRTAGGNISLAAKLGQKTRKEIYDALERVGLDPTEYRNTPNAED